MILIKKPKVEATQLEAIFVKAKLAVMKEFQLVPHDILLVDFNFPKTTSGKIQRNHCRAMYDKSVLLVNT